MFLYIDINLRVSEEESKGSEGGWIKVEYRKKFYRFFFVKINRERVRGNYRGRRIVWEIELDDFF